MPQVISKSGDSGKPDKKPNKSGGGVKLSGDVSQLPKPMLIGGGVVLLLIVVSLLFFTFRPTSKGHYDKVPPPPGYPDVAPYNSKTWQDNGRKPTPGIPSPEALKLMNGGAAPSAPAGGSQ